MYGFRYYFTPLTGVLFTFRSRYYCTIGRPGVLSLGGWSPRIHTGFHVSGDTWDDCGRFMSFRLRGFHPLRPAFPCRSPSHELGNSLGPCGGPGRSHNPDAATAATLTLHRFGLFPVRSPLLGESSFLSLPAGTEMFQFSAFPPHCAVPGHQSWSVTRSRKSSDHGLLSGSPKLIAAMLRPSSALDAKASTIHSSELNHCFLYVFCHV